MVVVKKSVPITILAISTIIILVISISTSMATLRDTSPIEPADIEQFMQEQVDIGPRHPGSQGSDVFNSWIHSKINDNWTLQTQNFTHKGVDSRNYWITSSSSDEWPSIIIGAHYDSRKNATESQTSNEPVPGANDGASGVAGILEMMEHVSPRLKEDIGFVLFDAEDQGGLDGWRYIVGSNYFANQMTEGQIEKTQLFVLYDMIADDELVLKYEGNSNRTLRESIWDTGHELGYEPIFQKSSGYTLIDDHVPFKNLGIPAVDLIDFDYPEWHTTEDTMDNVSAENAAIVVDVVLYWIENVFYNQFYTNATSQQSSPSSTQSSNTSTTNDTSVMFSPVLLLIPIALKKSSVF